MKRVEVLLDDADMVWRQLRYEPIFTVVDTMASLRSSMQAKEAERSAASSERISDLHKLMAALSTDEKTLDSKIVLHTRMLNAITKRYNKRKLADLIALEQLLVTGVTAEGSKASRTEVENELRRALTDLTDYKVALQSRVSRRERYDEENERLKPLLRAVYVVLQACTPAPLRCISHASLVGAWRTLACC